MLYILYLSPISILVLHLDPWVTLEHVSSVVESGG